MKKLIIFFASFLFAMTLDFSPCYQKYSYIKDYVPISKTLSVTFTKPKSYIFYDPFTKIYVFKHKNRKTVVLHSVYKLGWWMGAIKKDAVYGGTLAKDMTFLKLASLSVKSPKNSVISDIFCRAYGVGNGTGFLRGDYVRHFARYGYWGDVGIDVDENMRVLYVDPFYVSIKPGDKILKINSKKANIKNFEKFVILGKTGERVLIQTEKGKFYIPIRKKIYNFTPLLHYGIEVDRNLTILTLPEWIIKSRYLKPPVKLVKVNGKKIKSFEELKKILSFNKNVTITVEKNGIILTIPLRK